MSQHTAPQTPIKQSQPQPLPPQVSTTPSQSPASSWLGWAWGPQQPPELTLENTGPLKNESQRTRTMLLDLSDPKTPEILAHDQKRKQQLRISAQKKKLQEIQREKIQQKLIDTFAVATSSVERDLSTSDPHTPTNNFGNIFTINEPQSDGQNDHSNATSSLIPSNTNQPSISTPNHAIPTKLDRIAAVNTTTDLIYSPPSPTPTIPSPPLDSAQNPYISTPTNPPPQDHHPNPQPSSPQTQLPPHHNINSRPQPTTSTSQPSSTIHSASHQEQNVGLLHLTKKKTTPTTLTITTSPQSAPPTSSSSHPVLAQFNPTQQPQTFRSRTNSMTTYQPIRASVLFPDDISSPLELEHDSNLVIKTNSIFHRKITDNDNNRRDINDSDQDEDEGSEDDHLEMIQPNQEIVVRYAETVLRGMAQSTQNTIIKNTTELSPSLQIAHQLSTHVGLNRTNSDVQGGHKEDEIEKEEEEEQDHSIESLASENADGPSSSSVSIQPTSNHHHPEIQLEPAAEPPQVEIQMQSSISSVSSSHSPNSLTHHNEQQGQEQQESQSQAQSNLPDSHSTQLPQSTTPTPASSPISLLIAATSADPIATTTPIPTTDSTPFATPFETIETNQDNIDGLDDVGSGFAFMNEEEEEEEYINVNHTSDFNDMTHSHDTIDVNDSTDTSTINPDNNSDPDDHIPENPTHIIQTPQNSIEPSPQASSLELQPQTSPHHQHQLQGAQQDQTPSNTTLIPLSPPQITIEPLFTPPQPTLKSTKQPTRPTLPTFPPLTINPTTITTFPTLSKLFLKHFLIAHYIANHNSYMNQLKHTISLHFLSMKEIQGRYVKLLTCVQFAEHYVSNSINSTSTMIQRLVADQQPTFEFSSTQMASLQSSLLSLDQNSTFNNHTTITKHQYQHTQEQFHQHQVNQYKFLLKNNHITSPTGVNSTNVTNTASNTTNTINTVNNINNSNPPHPTSSQSPHSSSSFQLSHNHTNFRTQPDIIPHLVQTTPQTITDISQKLSQGVQNLTTALSTFLDNDLGKALEQCIQIRAQLDSTVTLLTPQHSIIANQLRELFPLYFAPWTQYYTSYTQHCNKIMDYLAISMNLHHDETQQNHHSHHNQPHTSPIATTSSHTTSNTTTFSTLLNNTIHFQLFHQLLTNQNTVFLIVSQISTKIAQHRKDLYQTTRYVTKTMNRIISTLFDHLGSIMVKIGQGLKDSCAMFSSDITLMLKAPVFTNYFNDPHIFGNVGPEFTQRTLQNYVNHSHQHQQQQQEQQQQQQQQQQQLAIVSPQNHPTADSTQNRFNMRFDQLPEEHHNNTHHNNSNNSNYIDHHSQSHLQTSSVSLNDNDQPLYHQLPEHIQTQQLQPQHSSTTHNTSTLPLPTLQNSPSQGSTLSMPFSHGSAQTAASGPAIHSDLPVPQQQKQSHDTQLGSNPLKPVKRFTFDPRFLENTINKTFFGTIGAYLQSIMGQMRIMIKSNQDHDRTGLIYNDHSQNGQVGDAKVHLQALEHLFSSLLLSPDEETQNNEGEHSDEEAESNVNNINNDNNNLTSNSIASQPSHQDSTSTLNSINSSASHNKQSLPESQLSHVFSRVNSTTNSPPFSSTHPTPSKRSHRSQHPGQANINNTNNPPSTNITNTTQTVIPQPPTFAHVDFFSLCLTPHPPITPALSNLLTLGIKAICPMFYYSTSHQWKEWATSTIPTIPAPTSISLASPFNRAKEDSNDKGQKGFGVEHTTSHPPPPQHSSIHVVHARSTPNTPAAPQTPLKSSYRTSSQLDFPLPPPDLLPSSQYWYKHSQGWYPVTAIVTTTNQIVLFERKSIHPHFFLDRLGMITTSPSLLPPNQSHIDSTTTATSSHNIDGNNALNNFNSSDISAPTADPWLSAHNKTLSMQQRIQYQAFLQSKLATLLSEIGSSIPLQTSHHITSPQHPGLPTDSLPSPPQIPAHYQHQEQLSSASTSTSAFSIFNPFATVPTTIPGIMPNKSILPLTTNTTISPFSQNMADSITANYVGNIMALLGLRNAQLQITKIQNYQPTTEKLLAAQQQQLPLQSQPQTPNEKQKPEKRNYVVEYLQNSLTNSIIESVSPPSPISTNSIYSDPQLLQIEHSSLSPYMVSIAIDQSSFFSVKRSTQNFFLTTSTLTPLAFTYSQYFNNLLPQYYSPTLHTAQDPATIAQFQSNQQHLLDAITTPLPTLVTTTASNTSTLSNITVVTTPNTTDVESSGSEQNSSSGRPTIIQNPQNEANIDVLVKLLGILHESI